MKLGTRRGFRRTLAALAFLALLATTAEGQDSADFGAFHCEMLDDPDGGAAVASCRAELRGDRLQPRSGRYQNATAALRFSRNGVFLAFKAFLGFDGETIVLRYWYPDGRTDTVDAKVRSETAVSMPPAFARLLAKFESQGHAQVSFRPTSTARRTINSTVVVELAGIGEALAWIETRSP